MGKLNDSGGASSETAQRQVLEPGQREHHLATRAQTMARLERILDPDQGPFTNWTERGAICIVTESTGSRRTTLLIKEVVEPDEHDLTAPSEGDRPDLEFNPGYRRRARKAAKEVRGDAGLLYVHSHPPITSGDFSDGDREFNRSQLYQDAKRLGDDVPLAAAVVHEGSDPWRIWRYSFRTAKTPRQRDRDGFGRSSMEIEPITAIRVADVVLEKRETMDGREIRGPRAHRGRLNADQQESTITLWGKEGQRKLAGLRVGVVGCGGGGSILAEVLPRVGVGELVLVDFDRVKATNQNRHLGASQYDVEQGRSKVEVSAEVAWNAATCPDFSVQPVVGSVFEEGQEWADYHALEQLLDCDLIMNAADPDTVRCVVSRLAYAHLIPVVDAGSKLRTDENDRLTHKSRSTVAVASPGNPCLKCSEQWSDTGFTKALTGEDPQGGYDDDPEEEPSDDEPVREPAAMPVNLLTMGLACQRALNIIHGLAPEIAVGRSEFRLHNWSMDWTMYGSEKATSCRQNCTLPDIALGDGADLMRGPDLKLRDEREGP